MKGGEWSPTIPVKSTKHNLRLLVQLGQDFLKFIERCRMETIQDFLLMEYNIYNYRIRIFHLSNFMTKLVI